MDIPVKVTAKEIQMEDTLAGIIHILNIIRLMALLPALG